MRGISCTRKSGRHLNHLVFSKTLRIIFEHARVDERLIRLVDPLTKTPSSVELAIAECVAYQIWIISIRRGITSALLDACRGEEWVVTANDAKALFMCVTSSLLQREMHWGIVVDLLAFVSCLCIHCINIRIYDAKLVDWISFKTVYYLNNDLGEWLVLNSWANFALSADKLYTRSELIKKSFVSDTQYAMLLVSLTFLVVYIAILLTMCNRVIKPLRLLFDL